MQKTLTVILSLAIGAWLVGCLALYFLQRSLIYYPPASAAYPAPRTTTLGVPGALVKVSERPLAGRRALIYLGGNAEDVTASLPLLGRAFPDRALYLLHYRGYTGSTGTPSEAALVADALALFDRVAGEHADVAVVGRSLGSGVAVQLAARRPVSRMVLVTPFDSLAGLAARQFPVFPVRSLLRDRYDSASHAPRVRAPTLLLAAGEDVLTPVHSARTLLARFPPGVASLRVIAGADHNTISSSPAFLASLAWVDQD